MSMKKATALLLALVLLLTAVPALAAGRLNVVQENYYTIKEGSYINGYVFAKLENNGNKAIKVNTGLLEIFDAEGDAITSTDSYSAYARYLEPGEYTYFRMSTSIKDIESVNDVDDYMLTVSGRSDFDQRTIRLKCDGEYKENVKNGYYTYNYMYATLTNDTEEPVYQPYVVFALLDADENIVYLVSDSLDSNIALMPGSSVLIRVAVDSDFVSYMEANNIVPTINGLHQFTPDCQINIPLRTAKA